MNAMPHTISRSFDVDLAGDPAGSDRLWAAIATADGWTTWLVDAVVAPSDRPDAPFTAGQRMVVDELGRRRRVVIRSVDEARSIEFAWSDADGPDPASVGIVRIGITFDAQRRTATVEIAETLVGHDDPEAAAAWERRVLCLWAVCVAAALV
jgi:uncharacterized protein YndB with AHSA1/START domain